MLCCKISIPLVGSTPEHLRMSSNVTSFHPMKTDLPKKPWQGYPESGALPYPLTRIKQLISLSQTRKCSLFFWSLMLFSGVTVRPWILGQKADCSVLTVTHLQQPHSTCLSLPHTKGFQQKDPTLWVWEPPSLDLYSFHTQSTQLIGLEQRDNFFTNLWGHLHMYKNLSDSSL